MASRTPLDKQIISVLRYEPSRPYLSSFKFSNLYTAQRVMRRNEYYDENGSRNMPVYIGKINGDVICGALWRLMEYNPVRFHTNPFLYDGKMNIYRFAADITLPSDAVTANVIAGVRGKLREYLFANGTSNGQWRDEIETRNGFVYTVLNDGRTGLTYKKLCLLRDAIKIVTVQNCADFCAKREPYREFIIQAISRLHPEFFAKNTQSAPVQNVSHDEIDDTPDTDRIYDKIERLQITLDNKNNVSPELYEQAREDMAKLMCELHNNHTL